MAVQQAFDIKDGVVGLVTVTSYGVAGVFNLGNPAIIAACIGVFGICLRIATDFYFKYADNKWRKELVELRKQLNKVE